MIDMHDLQIDVLRSAGSDGILRREVRVTHRPTGVTTSASGYETLDDDFAAAVAELASRLRGSDQREGGE
jgi:protein subunit release factor A